MFDYRITIQDDGVSPAAGMIIDGTNPPKEFKYEDLTPEQKAVYDAFVAMVKSL